MKRKIAGILFAVILIVHIDMRAGAIAAITLNGDSTGLMVAPSQDLIDMKNAVPGDGQVNYLYVYNTDNIPYLLYVGVADLHPAMENDYKLLDPDWRTMPGYADNIEYSQAADPQFDPYWAGLDKSDYPIQIKVYMDGRLLADFPAKGPGSLIDNPDEYPANYYLLGRVPAGGAAQLKVEVNFIALHMEQNPYQGKKAELEWRFIAQFDNPAAIASATSESGNMTIESESDRINNPPTPATVQTGAAAYESAVNISDSTADTAESDETTITDVAAPLTAASDNTDFPTDKAAVSTIQDTVTDIPNLTNIPPDEIPSGAFPDMPKTGEIPILYSYILGGLLILVGFGFIIGKRRGKKEAGSGIEAEDYEDEENIDIADD